jgi:hypothetical protein
MANPAARTRTPISFRYHTIRRISAPEDTEAGREIYSGHAPAESFFALPDDENVREYLLEVEGRKKKTPTQVHKAIRETLESKPQDFSVLNGGIVLVARAVEIDEKSKTVSLLQPSIINGSQTRGELKRYFDRSKEQGKEAYPVHVTFELIVTDDRDLTADISIARNFQNDVMTISIAGRRGQLDELQKAYRKQHPKAELRTSETDIGDDYVFTEKLLQVITALTPAELWPKKAEQDNPNKVYTYSMKTKCLKDFQNIYEAAKNPEAEDHTLCSKLYKFYLDIAGDAWDLYEKWKAHPKFHGTRLRSIERDGSEIVEVPDGIIFPILASLSAFARQTPAGWKILPPKSFDDAELVKAAAEVYKEIANSNPWNMGKSRPCYSSLYQITSIYRRLTQ